MSRRTALPGWATQAISILAAFSTSAELLIVSRALPDVPQRDRSITPPSGCRPEGL